MAMNRVQRTIVSNQRSVVSHAGKAYSDQQSAVSGQEKRFNIRYPLLAIRLSLLSAICCLLAAVCCVSPAWTVASKYLNYQGKLTDAYGKNLVGSHSLTFRIYDALTEGSKVWEETLATVLEKGIFTVMLGETNPIDITFNKVLSCQKEDERT